MGPRIYAVFFFCAHVFMSCWPYRQQPKSLWSFQWVLAFVEFLFFRACVTMSCCLYRQPPKMGFMRTRLHDFCLYRQPPKSRWSSMGPRIYAGFFLRARLHELLALPSTA